VDVERRRVWSFFWVIVIAWTHVIGFVFLTDRPELFQLPMWWIALWILWPISLLVYSLTGRPRHPFFD
jgi:Sec-independent protein secretion pathway component TatC